MSADDGGEVGGDVGGHALDAVPRRAAALDLREQRRQDVFTVKPERERKVEILAASDFPF